MRDNGNQQDSQSGAGHAALVIRALEDPRYEWRTVEGIAEQTGIPSLKVLKILKSLKEDVLRSSIPDESGRDLFTTRKHYRQTHGIGARILSALSDRVA